MELFERVQETVSIYKPPTLSGWSTEEAYWEFVQEIPMYIESVTGIESIQNQQNLQGITEFGISPIAYKDVIKEGYGVVDSDGVQRVNKGVPETWKFILPYCGYSLKREQFPIEVEPST